MQSVPVSAVPERDWMQHLRPLASGRMCMGEGIFRSGKMSGSVMTTSGPMARFEAMALMRAFEDACIKGAMSREIHGEIHIGEESPLRTTY